MHNADFDASSSPTHFGRARTRIWRRIENHYRLTFSELSLNQIVELEEAQWRQREAQIAETAQAARFLSSQLADLKDSQEKGFRILTDVVSSGFTAVAQGILEHRKLTERVLEDLRRPYARQVKEILDAATRAFTDGAKNDDSKLLENACMLYRQIVENPIGSQNYIAWFQLGWLFWNVDDDLPPAEDAFDSAAKFSEMARNRRWAAYSWWHKAHMCYLQGNFEHAYETIKRATAQAPDEYDYRFDAARYAAKCGRKDEAIEFLEGCIDQRPTTIDAMFDEQDFLE